MKKRRLRVGLVFSWICLGLLIFGVGNQVQAADRMPEFTTSDPALWINSQPMKVDALKGKVVLIEVWTSI